MAAIVTWIRRQPGPVKFIVGSILTVGVLMAVLRIVFMPGPETLIESVAGRAALAEASEAAARGEQSAPASSETAASGQAPVETTATVGDTLTTASGLDVTLVTIEHIKEIKQFHGSPFRPNDGVYMLVTIRYTNHSAVLVSIANERINLIAPDDTEISVDSRGTSALSTTPVQRYEARPLFLAESLPPGDETQAAVVFDVDPGLQGLRIEIEGLTFNVPDEIPQGEE